MEKDDLGNRPEVVAGVAMTIAREHKALREKAERGEARAAKGGIATAVVVVAVLVITLAAMLMLNAG